jgi:two-component system, LytTR family, response regulator
MRALVVDNEVHAREDLEALLRETGEFSWIGECANAIEALQAVKAERPDVLFLDIEMPQIDGFQLLSMLDEEIMPAVVFVTAYDEFALKAFEENALDYLLKPVQADRLGRAIEKLKRFSGDAAPPAAAVMTRPIERIPCMGKNSIKLVDLREVEYVRSGLAGVYVVTARGEFFTELTLKVLESKTDLVRCHRQYLVNVREIDEIARQEPTGVVLAMKSGKSVPTSRRFLLKLKDQLGIQHRQARS